MALEPSPPSARAQREIFLAALERSVPEERARYLDSACAGDLNLRRCVEHLLQEEREVGTFMDHPALNLPGAHSEPKPELDGNGLRTEQPGDRIGPYTLLERIGEGGCGTVYRAEQQEPLRRVVALKVLKLGMDTREVIRRFEAERQTLAVMDHPNIARIFDAGTTESGRPFFVMELVSGLKLTSHCEVHRLSTEQRLDLFIQICHAIQHAHQKGIIHRDIKPSNILVAMHDGRPVPKVIDFGIAKAFDVTQSVNGFPVLSPGHFLGTPAYMSPEQMESGGKDIDTRSDIYSLGVLLYELLTGNPPFSSEALLEDGLEACRRKIREVQPDRPSTRLTGLARPQLKRIAHLSRSEPRRLVKLVRGDLDSIVMKALDKERARRYSSAGDFAHDLECYLANAPVLARPLSPSYQLQKLIQRHRATFGAAAAVLLALLAGTAVSLWQAVSARQAAAQARLAERAEAQLRRQADLQRERASEQAALARLNEYVADINLANESMNAGNYGRAVQLLSKHFPQPGAPDLRGFEWRYLWNRSLGDDHVAFPNQDHAVRSVATSPTGELVALGTDRELKVWNFQSQALVQTLPEGVLSLCFVPARNQLIASTAHEVLLFDTDTWNRKALPVASVGPSAVSADGSVVAVVTTEGVQLWSTQGLVHRGSLPGAASPLAFSPDGKLLATGGRAGITLWELETFTSRAVLEDSRNLFGGPGWSQLGRVIAFSPDGQYLAAPRNTSWGVFAVGIWDVRTGTEWTVLPQEGVAGGHTGSIAGMAFSPEGILATASMDHSIRLWDLRNRRLLGVLHGHQSEVWAVVFRPDGHTLISGAKDGSVNLWSIPLKPHHDLLNGPYSTLAFANDNRTLAVFNRARAAVLFLDPLTRETKKELPLAETLGRGPPVLAFSADLSVIAEGMRDGAVRLYDGSLKLAGSLRASPGPVSQLALSPDGRQLVTVSSGRNVLWWDLASKTNCALKSALRSPLFSPDGRTLLLHGNPEAVELWDAGTRSLRFKLGTDHSLGPVAAFSPDGSSVALASDPLTPEQSIQLFEVHTGKVLKTLIGHKQGIAALAFSEDGRTLASSSHDGSLKLWNLPTGQELLSMSGVEYRSWNLRFSPDGTLLMSDQTGPEQGVRFYSAQFPSTNRPTSVAAGFGGIP